MLYIISAGGTGGHIYPALTMADRLSENDEVIFIAAHKELDHSIIDKHKPNYQVKYWNLSGFSRSFTPRAVCLNIINMFKLLILFIKSIILILRKKPKAVVGFGGYITFPIVRVASLFNVKTIIHEQNSYPGLVNKKLAKRVDKVAISYLSSKKYFSDEKVEFTSNPRAYVAKFYEVESKPKSFEENHMNILILGGSLGAQKINDITVEVARIDKEKIYHLVVGQRYYEEYKKYETENLYIYSYLNNIFDYIKYSDLVITRAGATTLLELVYLNKKIIAIPSPNVVANHQEINARELEKESLLKVLIESKLTVDMLLDNINNRLMKDIDMNSKVFNINAIQKLEGIIKE